MEGDLRTIMAFLSMANHMNNGGLLTTKFPMLSTMIATLMFRCKAELTCVVDAGLNPPAVLLVACNST